MNAYLLDTHFIIWFANGDKLLPSNIISLITDKNNIIWISIISLWEVAIKSKIGKLEMSVSMNELATMLNAEGFKILTVQLNHINTFATLPLHHKDPFDRMLIAQAISEDLILVSKDDIFKKYEVNSIIQ